jgi:hypothetical protein
MTNCKDIEYCVMELLNKNNVNIHKKDNARVVSILARYVNHLIFNMVAVSCLICLTIGIKKLVREHVKHLERYIIKRCKLSRKNWALAPAGRMNGALTAGRMNGALTAGRMNGGSAFNTAAFFGVPEPQYSVANAGGDRMNVDWNNNIARPMLASTMTGGAGRPKNSCNKLQKTISREIYNVFKFFKISTNKEARYEFIRLFNIFMGELFAKLHKTKVLTAKRLLIILKSSKISDVLGNKKNDSRRIHKTKSHSYS